jgi:hypothetical protein
MDQHRLTLLIALFAVAVIVVIVGYLLMRKRRSQVLRQRFGPEYDRVVKKEGDVHRGEDVLQFRAKRREKLQIRALSPANRSDFTSRWTTVQSQFVDAPKNAVSRADELVNEVMKLRGYPVGDFEERAADISVDHPVVVENYRAAHAIALRHNSGQASTEDLRQAMVHYRSLFNELLEDSIPERKEARG